MKVPMLPPTNAPKNSQLPAWIRHAVFVCGLPETDAAVRIHFLASKQALEQFSKVPVTTIFPGSALPAVGPDTCIVFYYNDLWGIQFIRTNGLAAECGLSLCFCSDIRHLPQYRSICDITDCFVTPSTSHASVLALNVTAHVGIVRELVDPAVRQAGSQKRTAPDLSVVWFGYAEGYHRSMEYLAPVLHKKRDEGRIGRYALLTNPVSLDPRTLSTEIVPFDIRNFQSDLSQFSYALLSHAPGDLHINSYIKSPNKLITALFAGLVPLATATPNYAELMVSLGLERFLFSSPLALSRMIESLDPVADQQTIQASGALDKLQKLHSLEQIHGELVQTIIDVSPQVNEIRDFVRSQPWRQAWDGSFLQFGECLRNLAPSGFRKLQQLLNRMT